MYIYLLYGVHVSNVFAGPMPDRGPPFVAIAVAATLDTPII